MEKNVINDAELRNAFWMLSSTACSLRSRIDEVLEGRDSLTTPRIGNGAPNARKGCFENIVRAVALRSGVAHGDAEAGRDPQMARQHDRRPIYRKVSKAGQFE